MPSHLSADPHLPTSCSFVPIGYGASELNDEKETVDGSPYGAAYVMGSSGSRGVSESDRRVGVYQGTLLAA